MSFKKSLKTSGLLKIKAPRFFQRSETTHPKSQRRTPVEMDIINENVKTPKVYKSRIWEILGHWFLMP
jgi:hypothetical protein